MKLTINGEDHQTDISDLSQLLTSLDYEGDWLATAVNGELVHRDERTGFVLSDRDRVEILSPMQGG
ncbi:MULTISPECIES: sulfur carrier protein ThiS [Rhizobium/Agrobacterium group]|jgi:sulfur carrier protein|uniref:sulfur carrier protein ThiS n=1 Tax=Rhizobium/Agrobacterium group TaxID=227290 RepID=UPI000714679C|nr:MULTISPECIES: sulfur carrier protein ThiS [Rhizobium/Agrobacterium group]KQY48951.1 thiamine biosynthesis protein ThiS [Rhizobium sp. Root483D2]